MALLWDTSSNNLTTYGGYSLQKLTARLKELRAVDPEASVHFDKDDPEALDFVTATANLRAHVFGIEEKSRFQVKGKCFLE